MLLSLSVLLLAWVVLISALPTATPLAFPLLQVWRPLPHVPDSPGGFKGVERRQALATAGAAVASGLVGGPVASATSFDPLTSPRSVVSVDSHASIPVWPSWAGGRVVPISLVRIEYPSLSKVAAVFLKHITHRTDAILFIYYTSMM